MMLTPCHYKGLSPFLRPHPAKLGMKAKSRFIREEQHPSSFASLDGQEFFLSVCSTLTPSWWPEHSVNRLR